MVHLRNTGGALLWILLNRDYPDAGPGSSINGKRQCRPLFPAAEIAPANAEVTKRGRPAFLKRPGRRGRYPPKRGVTAVRYRRRVGTRLTSPRPAQER